MKTRFLPVVRRIAWAAFTLTLLTSAPVAASAATPGASSVQVTSATQGSQGSHGTAYSCPRGGVLAGTSCVVTTSIPATPTTTYSCPHGGSVSGSSCVTGGTTSPATGATSYTCTTGMLSGSSCTTAGTTNPATATTVYSCPSGGSLSGSSCYTSSTSSYGATPSTTYSCPPPNGGNLVGTTCEYMTSYAATAGAPYSCPNGGTLSGTTCGAYSAGGGTTYPATPTYSCPSGGNLSGSTCWVQNNYSATPTTAYSCPSGGSLSGSNCIVTNSSNYAATPTTTYSCATGTLSGSSCITGGTTAAATGATGYVCATGTLSHSVCKVATSYPADSSNTKAFTASAIATDGTVFTATSDVSQASAQVEANAEATAYDRRHPTTVTVTPVSPVFPQGVPVPIEVIVSHAPNGAKGVAVITQFGPVAASKSACKSVSSSRFEAATHRSYIERVTGNAGSVVTLSPPKIPGCYAWGVTVTYVGGTKVTFKPSGKIATFVSASPLGSSRIAIPLIGTLTTMRHTTTMGTTLHQPAKLKTISEWNPKAISAKLGTTVLAGRVLAPGRGGGPLTNIVLLKGGSRLYVPTVSSQVTTWVVTKVEMVRTGASKVLSSLFNAKGAHRLVLLSVSGRPNPHTGAYPMTTIVFARKI